MMPFESRDEVKSRWMTRQDIGCHELERRGGWHGRPQPHLLGGPALLHQQLLELPLRRHVVQLVPAPPARVIICIYAAKLELNFVIFGVSLLWL